MQCVSWHFIYISDIFLQPGVVKQLIKSHEYLDDWNLWQIASKKKKNITKYVVLTELGKKKPQTLWKLFEVSIFWKKICLEWPVKNIFQQIGNVKNGSFVTLDCKKIKRLLFSVQFFSFLKGKFHFQAQSLSKLKTEMFHEKCHCF